MRKLLHKLDLQLASGVAESCMSKDDQGASAATEWRLGDGRDFVERGLCCLEILNPRLEQIL